MDSRRLKKWNTSLSYCLTSNQLNKDEKSFSAKKLPQLLLKIRCLICVHKQYYSRHFDDVITRTRRETQIGELVQIVTYDPKFILV